MTTTITVGNFKGGVGKTTTSTMLAYLMNKQGKRTLVVDFDPQANATEILAKTFNFDPDDTQSIMDSMNEVDLKPSLIHVDDNLDVIASDWKLSLFDDFLDGMQVTRDEKNLLLKHLLQPLKPNYDYIIIDTPPTLSRFTNNAIFASDYVLMVMQSQQQCYTSTVKFGAYVQDLHDEYDSHIDIIGIIPYLVKKDGKVDREIVADASKQFGQLLFRNQIFTRERIKLYGRRGIKNDPKKRTYHDTDVINMYTNVLKELEYRIAKAKGND